MPRGPLRKLPRASMHRIARRRGRVGILDRLLHDVARAFLVAQARGEDLAQRGILGELVHDLGGHALPGVDGDHLVQQGRRHDLGFAQRHHPLDDERDGDDRSEQQRVDRPAGGLDDGEQGGSPRLFLVAGTVSESPSRSALARLSTKAVDKFVDCR